MSDNAASNSIIRDNMAFIVGTVVITIPAVIFLAVLVVIVVIVIYSVYQRKKKNKVKEADSEQSYVISNRALEERNEVATDSNKEALNVNRLQNQDIHNSISCPDTSGTIEARLQPTSRIPERKSYPVVIDHARVGDTVVTVPVVALPEPHIEEKEIKSSGGRPPQRRQGSAIGPIRVTRKVKFELRFKKNYKPFLYKRNARVVPMEQDVTEAILPAENRAQGLRSQDHKLYNIKSRGNHYPLPNVMKSSKRKVKNSIPIISGLKSHCGPPIRSGAPLKRGLTQQYGPPLKYGPPTKSQISVNYEQPVAQKSKKRHFIKSSKIVPDKLPDNMNQQESGVCIYPEIPIPHDSSMITHGPPSVSGHDTVSMEQYQSPSGIELPVIEVPVADVKSMSSQLVPSVESTSYSAELYGKISYGGPDGSPLIKLPFIDGGQSESSVGNIQEFGDMPFSGLSSLEDEGDSNYQLSDILGSAESNLDGQSIELQESVAIKPKKVKLPTIVEDAEETTFTTPQAGSEGLMLGTDITASSVVKQTDPDSVVVNDALEDLNMNRLKGEGMHAIGTLAGSEYPEGETALNQFGVSTGNAGATIKDKEPGVFNIAKISNMIRHLVADSDNSDSISQNTSRQLSQDGKAIQLEMRNIQAQDTEKKVRVPAIASRSSQSQVDSVSGSDLLTQLKAKNARGWATTGIGDSPGETDQESSQQHSFTGGSISHFASQRDDKEGLINLGSERSGQWRKVAKQGLKSFKHSKGKVKKHSTNIVRDGSMQTCYSGDQEGNWNVTKLKEEDAEIQSLTDMTESGITMSEETNDKSLYDLAGEDSGNMFSPHKTEFILQPSRPQSKRYKKKPKMAEYADEDVLFPSMNTKQGGQNNALGYQQIGSFLDKMDDDIPSTRKDRKGTDKNDGNLSFSSNDFSINLEHDRSLDQFRPFNLQQSRPTSKRYKRKSKKSTSDFDNTTDVLAPENGATGMQISNTTERLQSRHSLLSGMPVKTGGTTRAPIILKPLKPLRKNVDSEQHRELDEASNNASGTAIKQIKEIGSEYIQSRDASVKKASKKVIFEALTQDNSNPDIPSLDMFNTTAKAKTLALSGGDFESRNRVDDFEVEFGKSTGPPSFMILEDALHYDENELNKRDSQLLRSEAESDL